MSILHYLLKWMPNCKEMMAEDPLGMQAGKKLTKVYAQHQNQLRLKYLSNIWNNLLGNTLPVSKRINVLWKASLVKTMKRTNLGLFS